MSFYRVIFQLVAALEFSEHHLADMRKYTISLAYVFVDAMVFLVFIAQASMYRKTCLTVICGFLNGFAGNLSKAEAIGMYWDYYHAETERLVAKYPQNVVKYRMIDLLGNSSTATQREMLQFVGVLFPKTKTIWHTNGNYNGTNNTRSLGGRNIARLCVGSTQHCKDMKVVIVVIVAVVMVVMVVIAASMI